MDAYGSDLSTFQVDGVDLDPIMPLITGPRVVLEACARRLMTPRGSLLSAPDYGYDLLGKLSGRMSALARERIGSDISAELLRDERVLSAKVTEFSDQGLGSWRIRIAIGLATGPFTLVISASSLTLTLLQADKG